MRISHLQEFIEVARYRSISKAADTLHMSQPALSAHISELEKSFGTQLFYRERPLRLTAAGQKCIERASEIVNTYAHMRDEITAMTQSDTVLALGYNETHHAANLNTFAALGRFVRRYPSISVQWVPILDPTAASALQEHAIDAVVCNLAPLDEDIRVGVRHAVVPASVDNRLYLWVDANSNYAKRESLTWADLRGLKLPHSEKNSLLWSSGAFQLLKNHGITITDSLRGEDNISFLQSLAPDEVQLFDAAYLNFPVLALFPNRVLVPIDEPDALNRAFIAYQPEAASPALKTLLTFLAEEAASEGTAED